MGRTILISSHILTEMTEYCTSIGIMEQGKLLKAGRVGDILREMQSGLRLKIEVQDDQERLRTILSGHPSVASASAINGYVECVWRDGRDGLPQLHRDIVAAGLPLVSFAVVEENLEDLYMRISGHRTS